MDSSTALRIIACMKPSMERDQLDAWAYDSRTIKLQGPLTNRVRQLSSKVCYRELMRRCFHGIDIAGTKMTRSILPVCCTALIAELHAIQPSLTGSFIDYLIRRMMAEQIGINFIDERASNLLSDAHICNQPPIDYNSCSIESLTNTCKEQGLFGYDVIDKKRLKELLEFKFPPCRIAIQSADRTCKLPLCQHQSYHKTVNTQNYRTCDIISEVFITSLAHSETFGGPPKQDTFDRMYQILQQTERLQTNMIEPLQALCRQLIDGKSSIQLNPILGLYGIAADADLILDNTLIDIKCTKSGMEEYELLQLLGYATLLDHQQQPMRSIQILNLLKGEEITYDIDAVTHDHWNTLLNVLTNKA